MASIENPFDTYTIESLQDSKNEQVRRFAFQVTRLKEDAKVKLNDGALQLGLGLPSMGIFGTIMVLNFTRAEDPVQQSFYLLSAACAGVMAVLHLRWGARDIANSLQARADSVALTTALASYAIAEADR